MKNVEIQRLSHGVMVYEDGEAQVYMRRMAQMPGDPIPSWDELEALALAELNEPQKRKGNSRRA